MYGRVDGREGKKEGVVVRFLGEEGSTVLWIGYGMGWMDRWMGGLKLGLGRAGRDFRIARGYYV